MGRRARLVFILLGFAGLLAGCASTVPDDGSTTRQTWTSRTVWANGEEHRANLYTSEQIAAPQPPASTSTEPVTGENWILTQFDLQNGRGVGRVCPMVLGNQKMTDTIFRVGTDSRCPEEMRHVTGWYPAPAPSRAVILTNAAGTVLGTFRAGVGTYQMGQLIQASGTVVDAAMRKQ